MPTTRDGAGRQAIDGAALARFAEETAAAAERPAPRPVVSESARNRFLGLVTKVTRDTVMAQVEIQAGPHRIVSLMSREAADELGLEPGVLAVAAVKSTNVVVEVPAPADSGRLTPARDRGAARAPHHRPRCPSSSLPTALLRLRRSDDERASGAGSPSASESSSITGTINVFAAASLQDAFTTAGQAVRGREPGDEGGVQLRPELGAGRADRAGRARGRVRVGEHHAPWTRWSTGGDAADPTDFVDEHDADRGAAGQPGGRSSPSTDLAEEGREGRAVPGGGAVRCHRPRRCSRTPGSRSRRSPRRST